MYYIENVWYFQTKHGEAAYPKDAWVEEQYRRNSTLPPNMIDMKMDLTPNNDVDNKTGAVNAAYVETNEHGAYQNGTNRHYQPPLVIN